MFFLFLFKSRTVGGEGEIPWQSFWIMRTGWRYRTG